MNCYRLIFIYIIKYGLDLWTVFLWSDLLLNLNFQPVGINCTLKVVLKIEIDFVLKKLSAYLVFLEHKNIENLYIKFFCYFHGHCTAYMICLMNHLDSISIICCIFHSKFPTNFFSTCLFWNMSLFWDVLSEYLSSLRLQREGGSTVLKLSMFLFRFDLGENISVWSIFSLQLEMIMSQGIVYLKKLCHQCFPSGRCNYYKKSYLVGKKMTVRFYRT